MHLAVGSRDRDRPSTSFSPRTLQTIIHIAVGSTEEQAATVLRFVASFSPSTLQTLMYIAVSSTEEQAATGVSR